MAKYLSLCVIIILGLASALMMWFSKDSYKILPLKEEKGSKLNLEQYNFQKWHEFTAPNGTFKVMLPALPQHATEKVSNGENGQKRLYEMYVSEKEDGTIFMISQVTFTDLKAGFDPEKLMKNMMNDLAASNPTNELSGEKEGIYKGKPSLDFTIGNKEHTIDARTFMVNQTMYILTRITKMERYNMDEYNFFINSFELIH